LHQHPPAPPKWMPSLLQWRVLRFTVGVPLSGHSCCVAEKEGLPKPWCELPCQGLHGTGGAVSRTVPLDIRRPPWVYSKAPRNRGSAKVKPHNHSTCGTKMNTKDTPKQYEVLEGVVALCSEWPKERKIGDFEKELAKAQLKETSKPHEI
jgi:hypothetical protein